MGEEKQREASGRDGDGSGGSRSPKSSALTNLLIFLLGVCCLVSVGFNVAHNDPLHHHHPEMAVAEHLNDFMKGRRRNPAARNTDTKDAGSVGGQRNNPDDSDQTPSQEKDPNHPDNLHNPHNQEFQDVDPPALRTPVTKSKLAGLTCDQYGGPDRQAAQELVYWNDIPQDQLYVSPLQATSSQDGPKYMTFEPDGGGWNNIRMAMETIVGLAIAMGRILVLPPEQGMYLLRKQQDGTKQRTNFGFSHFFPMHEMALENSGLDIITTEEFLQREAMTGHLIDKETKKPSFPPDNRTNWDGQDVKPLKEWLRNVTYIEHMWKPGNCLAAFPASGKPEDAQALQQLQQRIHQEHKAQTQKFIGHPAAVDGDPMDRMHENIANRKELCIYDDDMQSKLAVHFMCYHKMRVRYLVHFYAFLYFESWQQDLWLKRFMRDHMRYIDEIQCAAARIVKAVRDRSRKRQPEADGAFDTFHIRRGDFQFKTTRISAQEIYENTHDVLTENKTIYIATDEKDKSFFNDLKAHYDVVFLDDYMDEVKGLNTNYFGMVDQLVAAKGDVFVGCWFSTFTGFINRIRGYYSTKYKLPGYAMGELPKSYYYATKDKKFEMHQYKPLHGGYFNREFPTSWRDIDKDVGEQASVN
mmetsp:Transcript_46732/g.69496  ORF Transcript_46732/g.69496 Transcript_46732/m.69496 type:complete len:638 (-) Transcript_46732:245-2158(-)|eukprot:CAMPEP_0194049524 /NCGR_PEP_ID=MMETSP0009_2-20130614/30730_1 /TAXON_ID=210454 /ORGANISM="Grammatophora oceanica, Strain CCMP 410" /LENGTH=637 /DNA_ID=CAMNT_0038695703 /DNA_START=79 /DNA_END=1992 /DNA_ORIENTATION=+